MKAKKLYGVLGFLALLALLALAGAARAEMYVEGFIGGVQPGNAGDQFFTRHPGTNSYEFNNPIGIYDPQVVGGVKAGTWFVKEGFLGYNYPEWMKYTGFYLEFSYHRLDNPNQGAHTIAYGDSLNRRRASVFSSEGTAATLAFMFSGRYGFLKDGEVPFGRLQPYIGVGPAIIFTSMAPRLLTYTYAGNQTSGAKVGNDSAATLGICAELGLRWMALKNVSIDVFYNFRYARPKYSYNYTDPVTGQATNLEITPGSGGNPMHSGNVGVSYHF